VLTGKGKRDHLDARVGRPEQFVTIPSGVSLDDYRVETEKRLAARARFGLGGDDFVVGCVARITRVKGQIHLVRAAWQLKRKIPSLRLLMVGDGEDRREIETFAGNRFLESEAVFTGALDDPTQAFAAMDLCVMPSLDEGQGRAAIEAMAAGVPVIASDVGGLTEVLDSGKAGALVPPGDPAALADAIQSLAVDPAKRAQFAQAGRDRAELFSEDKMIRLLDSLYSELLGVPGMEN
jgi:glycosyltransferase involved in cell wall biosynthesis